MRALLIAGLVAAASTVVAADSSLVGSWRLVTYEEHPAAGGPSVYPFGKEPKGLLMYDPTGQMSIQIMKTPHPKVASGDDTQITPAEKQALLDAYMAYFGTYEVDAAKNLVTHHVEADLYDVFVGRSEPRAFVLEGDTLTLNTKWTQGGQEWKGLRVFRRVRAR